MSGPALFLVAAWILTLCPRGSPTSLGHPLPTPLRENHVFPPASGSNIPAPSKEQTSPPVHLKMPQDYSDEDYYDDDSHFTPAPRMPGIPQTLPSRCNYNRCHHLQVPCEELSRVSRCLCPGVSGPSVAPEPPRLQTIHVSEGGASVHWCAPSSTVQEYRLLYQPVHGAVISGPALNNTFRLAAVSGLSPGQEYLFCVVASNQAGSSPTDDGFREQGPCRLVRTPSRQTPYAYVAVGLACALIVAVVSVLAWHFCYRKKKHGSLHGSRDNILDGEPGLSGAANGSFRSEEQL